MKHRSNIKIHETLHLNFNEIFSLLSDENLFIFPFNLIFANFFNFSLCFYKNSFAFLGILFKETERKCQEL